LAIWDFNWQHVQQITWYKGRKRLEELGKVLFPVAGQLNEISRNFHDLHKFVVEDVAKVRFQTLSV